MRVAKSMAQRSGVDRGLEWNLQWSQIRPCEQQIWAPACGDPHRSEGNWAKSAVPNGVSAMLVAYGLQSKHRSVLARRFYFPAPPILIKSTMATV